MNNPKKKKTGSKTFGYIAAVFFACLVFLTGCTTQAVPAMDYQIDAAEDVSAATGAGVESKLLSQGICVIPKSSNTSTDAAITAQSALLINDTSGKVLYAQDIYSKQYPASVTKIVTALVALKNSSLTDKVTVSYNASHVTEYGAKLCGFKEGDTVSMKDLLYCLLLYSGNDAAIAIAEHVSGSVEDFAVAMNQEMVALGASGSHFVNPNGLHDDNHYTTAYDLYLVFHELLQYKPFQKIIRSSEYTVHWKDADGSKKSLTMTNTNQYLTGSAAAPKGITVLGGKTGTTVDAGSCLILYSRDKKKREYISVILKAQSSYSLYYQMSHLLDTI
jgi:D-alanyl-D-alanine carboxypeptidase